MDDSRKKQIMFPGFDAGRINSMDDFFAVTQTTGSIAQAGANTLYGFNQSRQRGQLPANKDTQGFTFFTRPMLNLNQWNLAKNRTFYDLLTTDENSIQRYVRCMLDPSLEYWAEPTVSSPLVDNPLVFIPLLSNTITKLSGWPDTVAPTFTSKEGVRKEQWSIIDGTAEINTVFSLDATFLNMADEPLSHLFKVWVNYPTYVFDGQLKPYAGMEGRNELDYTTRIYRLVLCSNEQYVKKIACTIASFPVNEPTGKFFDYNREQLYMDQTKEINVRFQCMGAVYNDKIIIKWFNRAAGYGNPELAKVIKADFKKDPSHIYEAIPHELLSRFRFRGYPLINTNTFELQWWIETDSSEYKAVLASMLATPT